MDLPDINVNTCQVRPLGPYVDIEGVENNRHSFVALLEENIPHELRQRPQWVVWQLEQRNEKPTKVPYIAGGVGRASCTDSLTWRAFGEAVQDVRTGHYDGIGFVFSSGDPYVGIDLDKCRNPQTGELETWARKIVRKMNGYAEVSPSGHGVHVIVRGKAPNRRRGPLEIYSSERFFTVTGRVLYEDS